jgi:hypothetical protein
MSAAAAQCDAPHGGVERYTTVAELVVLLSGHWFYCSVPAGKSIQGRGSAVARVGLEFTSDGHFYWLSPDTSDTVVRTEIAGYTIYPPNNAKYNNVSFQIDITYPYGSTMPTRTTFEPFGISVLPGRPRRDEELTDVEVVHPAVEFRAKIRLGRVRAA